MITWVGAVVPCKILRQGPLYINVITHGLALNSPAIKLLTTFLLLTVDKSAGSSASMQ